MAEFGKNTDGTNQTNVSADRLAVSSAAPSSNGKLQKLTARIWVASGTTVIKGVVYANSSGNPGSLLATGDEITVSNTTQAWIDLTFSGANQIDLTSGTTYWIGWHVQDPGAQNFSYKRDNTANLQKRSTATYSSGPPSSFGTPTNDAGALAVYATYTELPAPSGFTATEDTGDADLAWTDNSSTETGFEIQRKRGGSSNYYAVTTTAANATSYTDTTVDPGYTYTYRIRAINGSEQSAWVEATPLAMSGTKHWTSHIHGFLPLGESDGMTEATDGRILSTIIPEFATIATTDVQHPGYLTGEFVIEDNEGTYGVNAYTAANVANIKAHCNQGQFMVSAVRAGMSAMLADTSGKRQDCIDGIVQIAADSGFDPVLDFEGFGDWDATDYANYKTFVDDLAADLHAIGRKLSICGPPITNALEDTYYEWVYADFETSDADYIIMMLYDYQYDYGAGTSVQPAQWAKDGCARIRAAISDPDRIVVAMPSYGYHGATAGFTIVIDTKTESSGYTGYGGATRNADDEMTWTNGGNSYVYQDTTGLNSKRERIEDEGIIHVAVWHLGDNDWFSTKAEIDTLEATATTPTLAIGLSVQSVTGSYQEGSLATASVDPVLLGLSIPSVTATHRDTAQISPVILSAIIPDTTATHRATASVDPVLSAFSVQSVTAVNRATADIGLSPNAPIFQANGSSMNSGGGFTSISPAWPTHAINDIGLLIVETAGGQAPTLSVPAGFQEVSGSPQATATGTNGTRLTVYWCRATSASMTAPTLSSFGDHAFAVIITFRNARSVGTPYGATGGGVKSTASTSLTATGITTQQNNSLVILAVSRDDDNNAAAFSAWANANLTSVTERFDGGTTASNGGGLALTTGIKATAGATGNTTATVTSSANAYLMIELFAEDTMVLMGMGVQSVSATHRDTAGVSPVLAQLSVQSVTANSSAVWSAAMEPVLMSLAVQSVSGSNTETASVAPVNLSLAVQSVTAINRATAVTDPILAHFTVNETAATHHATAIMDTVRALFTIQSVEAEGILEASPTGSPDFAISTGSERLTLRLKDRHIGISMDRP